MLSTLKAVSVFVIGASALKDEMAYPNRLISNMIEPLHAKYQQHKVGYYSVPCQYYWNDSYYNFLTDDFNLKTFYQGSGSNKVAYTMC